MKPGLPGHVPMLHIEMDADDARTALLILHASALEREGNEELVPERLHGAIIALEEALDTTAADLLRGKYA